MTASKIVVGVDGSEHALRAVRWCAAHAPALDAEVIAVHVIEVPVYLDNSVTPVQPPSFSQREELRDLIERDWCKPLADGKVTYRVELAEGSPVSALISAAQNENAAFVVVGRRGLGGFKELILGSTSHQLSHHLDRPLVIVP